MAAANDNELSEDALMKALWSPDIKIQDLDKITDPVIASYVKEQSLVRAYPGEFMLGNLFTVTSNLLGKSSFQVIPKTWKEPIVQYTVIIGQRGSNKSGASGDVIDMILKLSSLSEADERAFIKNKIAEEVQNAAEQQNSQGDAQPAPAKKIKLDKLKAQLKNVKSSDYEKYFSNLTPQQLNEALAKGDGNLVLVQDEMLTWFNALNNGGVGDNDPKSKFCSLFGASRVKAGSKKMGETYVEDARVQICGYIQPDVFTQLLARGDGQGVFDRLTLLCPEPVLMDFEELCEQKATQDIHLDALMFGIAYSHMTPRSYTMNEPAKKLFSALSKKNNAEIQENSTAGGLRGVLKKTESKVLRSAAVNCALRTALERQASEERIPEEDRWYNLKLSKVSREEKIIKASADRTYLITEDDMQKAITLQNYSLQIFKICCSFATDLQSKTSGSKSSKVLEKAPIGGRNLGDPTSVDVTYAADNVDKIQGIFQLKANDQGKIKGTVISTAKFFPQKRIPGASTRDLCKFFLSALDHLGVIIYNKEEHLVELVKDSDDEKTREVFLALAEASKGVFNPLEMVLDSE